MKPHWKRLTFALACGLTLLLSGKGLAVEIIGHRGASHDAPENTLAAVNLAWKQGADAVEIDIFLSKDGRIVAIHDKTTKRYGGPDRKVVDQTFAELRALDVGRWKDEKFAGERIPTLAEVLKTIPDGKRLFIEIKVEAEILPQLKRDLKASGVKPEQAVLIGFSYETMQAAKKQFPQHIVYWVASVKQDEKSGEWSPGVDELIEKAVAAKLDGLDLGNAPAVIDREYVARVKQAGLGFFVWTVNEPDVARRLQQAGVDGITTDRPALLLLTTGLQKLLIDEESAIDVEQIPGICQDSDQSSRTRAPVRTVDSASTGAIP